MIKKIQIELVILLFLLVNIFTSYNIDVNLYNYFSTLNYGYDVIYLKEFFIGITELGDSLWYFLIVTCVFFISFIFNKIKLLSHKKYLKIKIFSIFSFSYIFLVGLITQLLKHLIGRPRPNYTVFDESLSFNFFSTDSAFHSFPSGHSSTIVSVVLILSLLIPSLRSFFYLFGFLIAISRVVVGAHFVTDVLAGAVVAVMVYKIFLFFFNKYYPNFSVKDYEMINFSLPMKSTLLFVIASLFITVGYRFDVFISGLFYYENNQFYLQSYNFTSIIFRKILLPFIILYIFFLPIFGILKPIQKIFFGYRFKFKEIIFIWFSGILTLILVVNFLLKNMWGRVRPNDILEFGGKDFFTPWYKYSEACASNCSFVSGDSSVGFMLIIFYFLTKKNVYFYMSLCCGASLGFIRIIAGGHFFSDIIFSQIVVTSSLGALFFLYKRYYDK